MSLLATRERGLRASAQLGIAWGLGHSASVAAVAAVLIGLGISIPPAFYAVFELSVALLLVTLGLSTLLAEARRHRRGLGDAHEAAHQAHAAHAHPRTIRNARSAFGFGVAHGLAGSGAVIVLLVAAATSLRAQLAYLLAFGLGTIGGMCVVSLLVGGVAGLAVARSRPWTTGIRVGAAAASVVVGVLLGWSVLVPPR